MVSHNFALPPDRELTALSNHSPGGLGLLLQFGESPPEGNHVPA